MTELFGHIYKQHKEVQRGMNTQIHDVSAMQHFRVYPGGKLCFQGVKRHNIRQFNAFCEMPI